MITIYQFIIFETSEYTFTTYESTNVEEVYKKAYAFYAWEDWLDDIDTDATPILSYEEFRKETRTYLQLPDYTAEFLFNIIHIEEGQK